MLYSCIKIQKKIYKLTIIFTTTVLSTGFILEFTANILYFTRENSQKYNHEQKKTPRLKYIILCVDISISLLQR